MSLSPPHVEEPEREYLGVWLPRPLWLRIRNDARAARSTPSHVIEGAFRFADTGRATAIAQVSLYGN